MIIKKYLATLRFYLRLNLSREFGEQIQEIIRDLSPTNPASGQRYPLNRLLVMVIGSPLSGKSAYIQNSPLKDYFTVDRKAIRNALMNKIPFLDGNQKIGGLNDWEQWIAIWYIHRTLFQKGFQSGVAIASDFRNSQRRKWKKILDLAKKLRYETRIIYFFTPPERWFRETEPLRGKADSLAIYNSETGELKELQNPA